MDKLTQGEQKIEQAKIDKRIAALYPGRDTTPERRQIDALTKQQDALNRRTHGNIAAASNASRTPQYPRPFLPGKGQWVTPSSVGPVEDCSAQMKEIERLQRLLKDAIEKMERMSLGARSSVGGKKSRGKKSRGKKSRGKKSRSKTSRRTKSRRKK